MSCACLSSLFPLSPPPPAPQGPFSIEIGSSPGSSGRSRRNSAAGGKSRRRGRKRPKVAWGGFEQRRSRSRRRGAIRGLTGDKGERTVVENCGAYILGSRWRQQERRSVGIWVHFVNTRPVCTHAEPAFRNTRKGFARARVPKWFLFPSTSFRHTFKNPHFLGLGTRSA